ncbi:hypothetical protein [Phaeodactylibacter xiamenensis]|jgi:hypothetical protein|uniref:hypothetical protein n=1 Tax=Phaeodactylibacter xiamenensis TaxID=1524460 RepID=UPI003BA9F868
MTPKKSLLTVTALLLAAWIVFSALNPGDTSYVIIAKFDGIYGNPAGAQVYITQERELISKFNKNHDFHSCQLGHGGTLNTEFRGVPNRETFIYILKEGFVPARYSFMPGDPLTDQEIGEVALVSYPAKQQPAITDRPQVPCSGQLADNPKLAEVQYLENFRPVTDFHCEDNSHTIVFQGKLIQSGQLVHQQDFSIIYPPHQQMGVLQTGTGRGK